MAVEEEVTADELIGIGIDNNNNDIDNKKDRQQQRPNKHGNAGRLCVQCRHFQGNDGR